MVTSLSYPYGSRRGGGVKGPEREVFDSSGVPSLRGVVLKDGQLYTP